MQISKQQLTEMLQSPQFKGQDPQQVVHSILSQGNTIEGLDISPQEIKGQQPTQPTTQQPKRPGGLLSLNPLDISTGFVKGAAETFTGLTGLVGKGIGKLTGDKSWENLGGSAVKGISQWANKSSNIGQSLGKGAEMIGELGAGEGALSKLATLPTTKAGTLAAKAGIGGTLFGAQEAAKTGDITKAPGAAVAGALLPVAGAGIAKGVGAIKGTLAENVGKALGFTGKMGVSDVTSKIPKAVDAFKTIINNAENIVVKDIDGIEKAFEPSKATFGETLQAVKQTKDSLYNQWSELASQAGEKGVNFAENDFKQVTDKLQDIISKRTSPYANKANQILGDIDRLFPTKQASLSDIQSIIEDINKDVNPLSDKASAEVSAEASRSLREIMDKKIESSTGEGYQQLRTQYSNLKSIENDLINKWKRSVRGTGSGVANWVEGFGTLDTAVSLLTGNVAGLVKGVGENILGKTMKYLRSPETNLQRAFDMIIKESEPKIASPAGKFIFGGGKK